VYFDIPQNEKPLLHDKDTVLFVEKTQGSIDSFVVNIESYYRISDKKYYHENILINYQKVHQFSTKFQFSVQRESSTAVSFNSYYYSTIYQEMSNSNYIINGKTFSSVFEVDSWTDRPDSAPSVVFYSHQQGIIAYKFPDNRVYELKSK
jgi:hypothetical protein